MRDAEVADAALLAPLLQRLGVRGDVEEVVTCMRSMTFTRRRLNDVSICAMPSSRPLVHTLVAMKSLSRTPSSAMRSPATDSELPYIGEESTTPWPAAAKMRTTSRSRSRSAESLPASNVCHVPRPIFVMFTLFCGKTRLA